MALIDLHFHDSGEDAGIGLVEGTKQLSSNTKCIIMTGVDTNCRFFLEAYRAGSYGFLRKYYMSIRSLPEQIKMVAAGYRIFDSQLAQVQLDALSHVAGRTPINCNEIRLTQREEEILLYVAQGYSNKEIADRLNISQLTVKTHIQHILEKTGLPSRDQAGLYMILKNSIRAMRDSN